MKPRFMEIYLPMINAADTTNNKMTINYTKSSI